METVALMSVCFGLRISECLALWWKGIDWLNSQLRIERAAVRQHVDRVKTIYSEKLLSIDAGLLVTLKLWKQSTQFSSEDDWVFASPVQLGRLPYSYPHVLRVFRRAGLEAGIGALGTLDASQLSVLAGCCCYSDCNLAEADAACRVPP